MDPVYAYFENIIDKETIDGIVNRHLALGSFVEDSGTLMSVVNDSPDTSRKIDSLLK